MLEAETRLWVLLAGSPLRWIPIIILGGWLTVRARVNFVVFGAGVLVAIAAIWWNILAVAFWLAPLPFMWVAYRARNDG